jgi:hypothetical protein
MNFQQFKEKFDSGSKEVDSWPGVEAKPSGFLLIQNQSMVPGWRFVVSLGEPYYCARVYSFETVCEIREFCLAHDGVMIAGHNTCLVFEGVVNSDRFPVSINYRTDIRDFLEGAAVWMQGVGG